jgi:hypothetical protein
MGKLGNRRVERREPAKAQLGSATSGPSIPVDHGAGLVTRAIRNPRFRATVRQAQGDESAPQIVDTHWPAIGPDVEELDTSNASGSQVGA